MSRDFDTTFWRFSARLARYLLAISLVVTGTVPAVHAFTPPKWGNKPYPHNGGGGEGHDPLERGIPLENRIENLPFLHFVRLSVVIIPQFGTVGQFRRRRPLRVKHGVPVLVVLNPVIHARIVNQRFAAFGANLSRQGSFVAIFAFSHGHLLRSGVVENFSEVYHSYRYLSSAFLKFF